MNILKLAKEDIVKRLAKHILDNGLHQGEVAKELDMSQVNLSCLLNGKNGSIRNRTYLNIYNFLKKNE